MRRFNGLYVVLALFGIVNLFDALACFGGHAVDLPQPQFFLYSAWVFVRNVVGYTLIMAAPVSLLGKHSRFLTIGMFCYVVVIEAATRYSAKVFHADLSGIWLQLLENSSIAEVVEFLKMSATGIAVAVTVALALTMVAGVVLIWRAHYPKMSSRSFAIGIAFCVPFFVANCLLIGCQYNWKFGINQMRYTQFISETIRSIMEMRGINQACTRPILPDKLQVSVNEENMPDGVFVLGESSTRNNWHLYGYMRQTTPRMDALCERGECDKFEDVVGTQPETVGALALLLTDVSFDDKSHGNWTLAEVYRRAGYRCVLISNQYSWGDTTSTLYRIFNGCEKRTSPRIEFGRDGYDEELVPILERELVNGDSRPTIVFLHLAGIHYPVRPEVVHPQKDAHCDDTVDEEFMKQFSSHVRDRLNRYDDGILYEDKVLGMVVDVLRRRDRPSFMFFISDHGESPRSDTWRSYADEDVYELPALLWISPSYSSRFPELAGRMVNAGSRRMQSDEMTYGLLELGFIRGVPMKSSNMSFFSDGFEGRSPRFINKGRARYSRDVVPRK